VTDPAWTRHLPPEARTEMDTELAGLAGVDRTVALAAWHSTALVYADPELLAALSADAGLEPTPERDGYTIAVYLPRETPWPTVEALTDQIMDAVHDADHGQGWDAHVAGQAGDPLGIVDGTPRP
jgi:hypothetical protein